MTSSGPLVANITYQHDGPVKVYLERLLTSIEISGYAEVSSNNIISLSKRPVYADAGIRKAYNQGLRSTLRVQQFLTSTTANKSQSSPSAIMNVGATSTVGGPPARCHARDGPASFEEVDFEFLSPETQPTSFLMASFWTPQVPHSLKSTQYLHFACPTLKLDDAIVDRNGHSRYDSISITSGIRLFSNNLWKACDLAGGNLGLTPLGYPKPTIYEIEFIARAAPAIADLACTVLAGRKACGFSSSLSINLDIPTWHYYEAIDLSLKQGLCTTADALLYVKTVEKRHDQVSTVFETAIRYACSVRGYADPVINTSSRLNPVSACIKSALSAGFRPGFEDVMQELHEEKRGTWRQFLELIPGRERPEDFQSLGRLSHVYEVMKTAFLHRGPYQTTEYDFEPSLQVSAPEEMSICLPAMPAFTGFSSGDLGNFYLNKSKVGHDWSPGQVELIGEIADEDDNELCFDASSTVDIKVLSSEAWASSADTDFEFGDDRQLECITVIEDASYRTVHSEVETVFCRSPRLIGQEVLHSRSNATHLSPTSDSVDSAACMAGLHNEADATVFDEAGVQHSNDAMLSTLKEASSFCFQASATCSEPSSDDELASHGFMLPSPVLSRSFWAPSGTYSPIDEALPILTDDDASHTSMLSTHTDHVAYQFNMDKGITENDGKPLDEMASLASMVYYRRARATKQCAFGNIYPSEPASKDERLSCAAMLPTSTAASNLIMADAGWSMDSSGDDCAAHSAMLQCLRMAVADDVQPTGNGEIESCIAMLPTSEAASSAVMILATVGKPFNSVDDEHTSHANMLTAFTEPESLEMAKHLCMVAALTPIHGHDNLDHAKPSMDEYAAHAAMMITVDAREEDEGHEVEDTNHESDDAVVSHFAMLSVNDGPSSSGMVSSLGLRDAGAAELSATMPMDDHVSHLAMTWIAGHESTAYMLSTLSPDDTDGFAEMNACNLDVELASHAAMRGIVDLSSSFCMAKTLTAGLQMHKDTAGHAIMEVTDINLTIFSNGQDEDASNIAMLYPAAEEDASHAAMVSVADHLTDMDINEQASHIAMLPDSIAPFFIGKSATLATILEDTFESLASHAVMLPTSNDERASHKAMLPTSTDDTASHEIMWPTSDDEVVSHAAMTPDTSVTETQSTHLNAQGLDSHAAMLTSSICMAATLREKRTTATRASSIRSSSSSAHFVKLPQNQTTSAPPQLEKPRVLILSLDDCSEKRTYTQAQKLLKTLRDSPDADTNPTLIEAYLMNRVFANDNAEGEMLYFEDPSPELPVGEDGLKMEPVELVRKLYGEEAASNLDKWFKDVGLGL